MSKSRSSSRKRGKTQLLINVLHKQQTHRMIQPASEGNGGRGVRWVYNVAQIKSYTKTCHKNKRKQNSFPICDNCCLAKEICLPPTLHVDEAIPLLCGQGIYCRDMARQLGAHLKEILQSSRLDCSVANQSQALNMINKLQGLTKE